MRNTFISAKNKYLRLLATAVLTLAMACTLIVPFSQSGYAAENVAYEVLSYDKVTTINKNHSYKVDMKLTVNIPEKMKSLDIVLPTGNFKISKVEAKDVTFNVVLGSKSYITITDVNALTEGKHTFRISYTMKEYAERQEDYDMLFYDVLLPEWRVPISKFSAKIYFPSDFPWDDLQYYAGQFGVSGATNKINYTLDQKAKTVVIAGERIPENYSITLKAQLPQGYWVNPLDNSWAGYAIPAAILVVLMITCIFWMIGGKDPRVKRTSENKPIDGVLPSDITYIYEGRIRARDIVMLILYMATKGYLKIAEFGPKQYRLYRLEDPKGEEKYIRTTFSTLFEGVYKDRSINVADIGKRLERIHKAFEDDIRAGYSDKSMASKTLLSKVLRIVSVALVSISIGLIPAFTNTYRYVDITWGKPLFFAFFTAMALNLICARENTRLDVDDRQYYATMGMAVVIYGVVIGYPLYEFVIVSHMWPIAAVAFILAMIAMYMCVIMPARGEGNAKLTMRLNQLRKFIFKAKASDVKPLLDENPNYFYDMLPYAIILQGADNWAKAFSSLPIKDPGWYFYEYENRDEGSHKRKLSPEEYAKSCKAFMGTVRDVYHKQQRRRYSKKQQ